MKRSCISLFVVGVLVALMFNPLVAGNQKSGDQRSGPMIIPISGTGGDEVVYGVDEYLFDDEGNLIGIRGMDIEITSIVDIPMLGIEGWVIPVRGLLDLDFYGGDPYILKFRSQGSGMVGEDELILESTFGLHRIISATMTEKYITSTDVFVAGPLEGVVMTRVSHTEEPLVDPPPFTSTFTGFLYVPAHVDLEDLKSQGKRFGSLNK